MEPPLPGAGDPDCPHTTREDGVCAACGHCAHDIVLNGACYFCGSTTLDPVALSPKPVESFVPAGRLVRRAAGRDDDER